MKHRSGRVRLAGRLVKARARGRPHTLSHLITSRCNARCETCLWRDGTSEEADTPTIAWLYREAARAGFAQLVVWGGEPLLRDDLDDVLAVAKRAGLYTTLISNGWLIAARWPELRGNVDALILSVDDVGVAHDRLRGMPGLYDRVSEFALSLQSDPLAPLLLLNTVLSRRNLGALSRVAVVAKAWRAGLFFCPMETGQMQSTGFVESLSHLALPPGELSAAAREARRLRGEGYPILATRAYLDLLESDPGLAGYRCRAPHSLMTVGADGAVRDCRRHDQPITNVMELRASGQALSEALALPRRLKLLAEADSCSACNNPDVIELSWLWDLRPVMLQKFVRLAAR